MWSVYKYLWDEWGGGGGGGGWGGGGGVGGSAVDLTLVFI